MQEMIDVHGRHLPLRRAAWISTSLIASAAGAVVAETRYLPYGQVYWQWGASQTDFGYTGQRMDGFGLMDYNARYYDPLLERFISPDSIIPQPGSPLAWDRYAYVKNNPLNFIDPSGHRECQNRNDCDIQDISNDSIAKHFGVVVIGFSEKEKDKIVAGIAMVANRLADYSGDTETKTFKKTFGSLTVRSDASLANAGWFGMASDGVIRIQPGLVTPRLLTHELGHSFEMHMYNTDGGRYSGTDNPIQLLAEFGIYDGDTLITGQGNRHNGKLAPENGYYSDSFRDEGQYHPRNMVDGNTPNEDWADIFMNWTYSSFVPNPAGNAITQWVNNHMAAWMN